MLKSRTRLSQPMDSSSEVSRDSVVTCVSGATSTHPQTWESDRVSAHAPHLPGVRVQLQNTTEQPFLQRTQAISEPQIKQPRISLFPEQRKVIVGVPHRARKREAAPLCTPNQSPLREQALGSGRKNFDSTSHCSSLVLCKALCDFVILQPR